MTRVWDVCGHSYEPVCGVLAHRDAVPQDEAFEESQKYKEGKCVIEKEMMVRGW